MTPKSSQQFQFAHFAKRIAGQAGRPGAFLTAVGLILAWAISGPIFSYSDTWQLVINTGTTIVTFLMVFLIQNTQNRDTEALQIKLDELIKSISQADNSLLDLEDLDEDELESVRERYLELAKRARARAEDRRRGAPKPVDAEP